MKLILQIDSYNICRVVTNCIQEMYANCRVVKHKNLLIEVILNKKKKLF